MAAQHPRKPNRSIRAIQQARRINWVTVLAVARWIYDQGKTAWGALTPRERSRLGELVRKAAQNRALPQEERDELRRLVTKAVLSR
jgi:hypothetical protein